MEPDNVNEIRGDQLTALTGLPDGRHRELAGRGFFPPPRKGLYQLAETIRGIMRFYRERDNEREILDVYDSIAHCGAATGIPLALIKQAKKAGAPAFQSNRVKLLPLLKWCFSQREEAMDQDWAKVKTMWQAKREEGKYQRDSGEAVERAKVIHFFGALAAKQKRILRERLENELPAAMAGVDPGSGRVIAKRVTDEICAEMVRAIEGLEKV